MSYFALKRKQRLQQIIKYVEDNTVRNYLSLQDEVIASFGVTPVKAKEYVDTLIRIGVLKFVEGKKAVIKDGRKLEAMK
jgi:hypothetical protein